MTWYMGWAIRPRPGPNARPRVIRGTRTTPLPLLPSGPGGVCSRPLHGARDLTSNYRSKVGHALACPVTLPRGELPGRGEDKQRSQAAQNRDRGTQHGSSSDPGCRVFLGALKTVDHVLGHGILRLDLFEDAFLISQVGLNLGRVLQNERDVAVNLGQRANRRVSVEDRFSRQIG